jgi:hypothetical protein
MDVLAARTLTSQLSEDLAWLEQHARQESDDEQAAAQLRLAAALVRNCVGPLLDGQGPAPLHVVVVGGAGAGKSTVSNMLSGAVAAEANPQAGFTRHPIAYTNSSGPITWTHHAGFFGPLSRLTEAAPSSIDQDVYQIRRVPTDSSTFDLLKDFVVWDCPDMTTWAAQGYVPRLLEAAGLADVLVYVASDERYNDEIPTQFLRLLLETGKPVVCCLMKMREQDAPALVAHFQSQVLSQLPQGVVATLAIPQLTREQLADPARQAARYRVPLVNQVAVLGRVANRARQRTIIGAMRYLMLNQEQLFAFAQKDLDALRSWERLVAQGRDEFDTRYVKEYLATEKFRGFDEALIKLLELLELPGIGKVLSGALYVVRLPVMWLAGLFSRAVGRPQVATRPELPVLEEDLNGWIDGLRKEMARQAGTHPLYELINKSFHSGGLAEKAKEKFNAAFKTFQAGLALEVDRSARAIYEELEKNPVMLNTLRGSKLLLDTVAIGGTLAAGGINWTDFVLVPIVATLSQKLVELLGKNFVDAQREATRQRQLELMKKTISGPLAQWLSEWPSTGGSAFERLQKALHRIPANLDQVNRLLHEQLQQRPTPVPAAG